MKTDSIPRGAIGIKWTLTNYNHMKRVGHDAGRTGVKHYPFCDDTWLAWLIARLAIIFVISKASVGWWSQLVLPFMHELRSNPWKEPPVNQTSIMASSQVLTIFHVFEHFGLGWYDQTRTPMTIVTTKTIHSHRSYEHSHAKGYPLVHGLTASKFVGTTSLSQKTPCEQLIIVGVYAALREWATTFQGQSFFGWLVRSEMLRIFCWWP